MTTMKRLELFEFEDFAWLPAWLRTAITNLIVVLHKVLGISEILATLLAKLLQDQNQRQIVDLGSGSGGAMSAVLQALHTKEGMADVTLLLTDLHPNPDVVQRFNSTGDTSYRYLETALDASDFATAPAGIKTMVNSFHHLPPEIAQRILQSAQDNGETLLIYEMAENKAPVWAWALLLPISIPFLMLQVILMTPFVRPLHWWQLVFTYPIPLIPVVYAWDGLASTMRIYPEADVRTMLAALEPTNEHYTWEIAAARKANGQKLGMYVLGRPSLQEV
ncbi:MAG: hypothetical protein AAF708_11005 [Deinococcota bacterium]